MSKPSWCRQNFRPATFLSVSILIKVVLVAVLYTLLVPLAWSQQSKAPTSEVGAAVFARASPSVFLVQAQLSGGARQGSGVAFRYGYNRASKPETTWIATNAHVVLGSNSGIVASAGKRYSAKVEYVDADFDISLILVGEVLPVSKFLALNRLIVRLTRWSISCLDRRTLHSANPPLVQMMLVETSYNFGVQR